MEYKVVLETFEGPFDLLYHLIEKAEVDIYDIPIAEIADQYISYIENMEELDLELTSEFLVMASTLLEIKSKMLLPQKEDEGLQLEMEEVDPREELVRKLIEYKRYKEAAKELKSKEKNQKKVFFKPKEEIVEIIDDSGPILEGVEISDLIKAFDKIMEKHKNVSKEIDVKKIQRDEVTIEEGIEKILYLLKNKKSTTFDELFNKDTSKANIIVTFLAILELVKIKSIKIKQEGNFGDIIVELYRKHK